jgi:HTH-type transcriptional regulator / antitoxin HipB
MWAQTPGEVGKIIAFARRQRGLKQAELAVAVGTTQAWISAIEKGKATAHIGKVLGVLSYLNVRLKVGVGPGAEQSVIITPQTGGVSLSGLLATLSTSPKSAVPSRKALKRKSKR